MSILKKSLVTLALIGGFVSQANASPVSVTFGGNGQGPVENFDELSAGLNSGTVALSNINATLTFDNSQIVSGANPPVWLAPFGDSSQFLSTQGPGGNGSVFTLSSPTTYFGFLWGSVDPYNTIYFLDSSNTIIQSFTGNDIISGAGLTASSSGADGTVYANFSSTTAIAKVVMASSLNAFEVDDVTVGAVPLPAALPLFGAALMGLGAGGRFRRKAANA